MNWSPARPGDRAGPRPRRPHRLRARRIHGRRSAEHPAHQRHGRPDRIRGRRRSWTTPPRRRSTSGWRPGTATSSCARRASAPSPPPISREQLSGRGIDTLILAGISTSGVVLSTVRDGSDRDYRLLVLSDATADRDPAVHACLMEQVFPRQAEVITVAELGAGRMLAPAPPEPAGDVPAHEAATGPGPWLHPRLRSDGRDRGDDQRDQTEHATPASRSAAPRRTGSRPREDGRSSRTMPATNTAMAGTTSATSPPRRSIASRLRAAAPPWRRDCAVQRGERGIATPTICSTAQATHTPRRCTGASLSSALAPLASSEDMASRLRDRGRCHAASPPVATRAAMRVARHATMSAARIPSLR